MNDHYFTKRVLSFPSQDLRAPEKALRDDYAKNPAADMWGIWQGVFGLAANQLIVMSAHTGPTDGWRSFDGCEVEAVWVLRATARPQSAAPLTRAGVYVFRDFWLPYEHVAEAVELSSAAWKTFEGAAAYSAEPMGLFAPAQALPDSQECLLHLLTWYPDFTSWETSRQSDPAAMQRFIARRELTRSTRAVATRLILPS
ncbi:MAG: hypothetical protein L7S71_00405 [Pseudomonadales bacterium]|nr:hypothetical protein [Gammaproteobacteria bacterium]MCH1596671.1 hypothetical protein [Pseudomonadales bacterium]